MSSDTEDDTGGGGDSFHINATALADLNLLGYMQNRPAEDKEDDIKLESTAKTSTVKAFFDASNELSINVDAMASNLNALALVDLSSPLGVDEDLDNRSVYSVPDSPQRPVNLLEDQDRLYAIAVQNEEYAGANGPVVRTTPIPLVNYPDGTKFHSNGYKYSKLPTDGTLFIPPEDMDIIATDLDVCRVRERKVKAESCRDGFYNREDILCRKITCNHREVGLGKQQFCGSCFTSYLPDNEANKARKERSARKAEGTDRSKAGLPKLIRHKVPPEYEGRVRNGMSAETLLGYTICRLDVCQNYAVYPFKYYEGFCCKHHAKFSLFNMMIQEARIAACQAALSTNPEDLSFFDYFFSHMSPSGDDADVHMAMNLPWCHFTDVDLENGGWKLVGDEIVLVCNDDLGMETLEAVPHWKDLDPKKRNPNDKFVWGTTTSVGGLEFIEGHHNVNLSKGKVLYCLVFTVGNEAYRHKSDGATARANQYRIAGGTIGLHHECMVRVQEKATPCHVLKIEFTEDYVEGGKSLKDIVEITAIRVNGKMKDTDAVEIDTKVKSNFTIAKGFIECTHNEEESE